MKILLIINLILNTLYLSLSVFRLKRVPESISETSYMWEDECSDNRWFHKAYIFSLYCFLTAGLLLYPWIMSTPDSAQFLCFLGCAGMLAAGVTPFFRESFVRHIHYWGGILAFICWFTWMIGMEYYRELATEAFLFTSLTIWKRYAYTFWIEVISLYSLLLILLLR